MCVVPVPLTLRLTHRRVLRVLCGGMAGRGFLVAVLGFLAVVLVVVWVAVLALFGFLAVVLLVVWVAVLALLGYLSVSKESEVKP